jgi:hypothetical protein
MIERSALVTVLMCLCAAACEPADLTVPSDDEIEEYYVYEAGTLDAEVKGNVAVVTVSQSAQQLRRGGTLWAKVGPYIFLFSDESRQLLEDFSGLAGIRVVTTVGDSRVAEALLARDALSDIQWRRSLNIAGHARRDGTQRVTRLSDLVRWGEDHVAEYDYNPRYARAR